MGRSSVAVIICSTLLLATAFLWWSFSQPLPDYSKTAVKDNKYWIAPDTLRLPDNDSGRLIKYGRELIAHTALYFGPHGKIAPLTNGMNCQNCHLDAGTRMWGNNYSGVSSTYPKFRERRGAVENTIERVEDCFVRSLAGKPIDSNGLEMKAIVAYINWLGNSVAKGIRLDGTGIHTLPHMDRAADTAKGMEVYSAQCKSCHQPDGEGLLAVNGIEYQYPPLWGAHSYNVGAGIYRLERLSGYIKYNMPFGTAHTQPVLTDEEAWDVAAYINSKPHPSFDISRDFPDKKTKPFDHPFGPYADTFSENQHKYGPYAAIIQWKENHKKK